MLGNSPAMLRLFETIERVAPSKSSVTITGEIGTGKKLVAKAIHSASNKISFITVNCATLSYESMEIELFGHEKATNAEVRYGAFEQANKGTIFLDQVDMLPPFAQTKIMRVLDSGEVRRIGSHKSSVVDARVIVSTNKDLKVLVNEGKFREDLYWRLSGVPLQTVPLRARKEDLPILVDHFIAKNSPSPESKPFFTDEAMKKLKDYHWPGNVRELGEIVFRSMLKRNGDSIDEQVVSFESLESHKSGIDLMDLEKVLVVGKTFQDLEDEIYAKAYLRMKKSVQKAADSLGISRQTIKRRLDALGFTKVERASTHISSETESCER
jgi:DNA-binding NtrC family response regulator